MKSDESPLTITLENAVKLIKDRKLKFEPKVLGEHPKTKNEISIKRGDLDHTSPMERKMRL